MIGMVSRRRASKPYVCTYTCGGMIKSGSVYLRHTGKSGSRKKGFTWEMLRECGGCATMHGRAGLLEVRR